MSIMTIVPRTAPSGNQATIRAMLDRNQMRYEVTTDHQGIEHIHVYDTFRCNGRTGYVLRDVTNWSLHHLGCWLGY